MGGSTAELAPCLHQGEYTICLFISTKILRSKSSWQFKCSSPSSLRPLPTCSQAITDIVDGGRPSHEEFLENLHAAAAALQSTLPQVLEFMAGKQISEL